MLRVGLALTYDGQNAYASWEPREPEQMCRENMTVVYNHLSK
jgi:hypothetical protein